MPAAKYRHDSVSSSRHVTKRHRVWERRVHRGICNTRNNKTIQHTQVTWKIIPIHRPPPPPHHHHHSENEMNENTNKLERTVQFFRSKHHPSQARGRRTLRRSHRRDSTLGAFQYQYGEWQALRKHAHYSSHCYCCCCLPLCASTHIRNSARAQVRYNLGSRTRARLLGAQG